MGDPRGPWRHRGDDDDPDRDTPRHLLSRPAGYDLGYGQHPRDGRDDMKGPAAAAGRAGIPRTPRYVDRVHGGWDGGEADTGRIPAVPGPTAPGPAPTAVPGPAAPRATVPGAAGPRTAVPSSDVSDPAITGTSAPGSSAHGPTPTPMPPVSAQDWPDPDHVARGVGRDRYDGQGYNGYGYDGYGDAAYGDEGGGGSGAGGVVGSVRAVAGEAAWRYRSAPLWVRISADVVAAGLVLMLIVGVSLALRQEGAPEQAASTDTRPRTTTTVSTTTTTVATTTTTVATTTTAPTTTTTVPPTTTTAAPIVPPPTEAPTTTSPTTTTTEPVNYRSCRDAMGQGALPLVAGDPGYHPRLDSDGDGEACDDFEDWDGRGD